MTLQEEELKNVCNMGLPHRILYATNVNREDGWICLSAMVKILVKKFKQNEQKKS